MARHRKVNRIAVYTALTAYTLFAIFPIVLVMMNSLKDRAAIFGSPLSLPNPTSFSLTGFQQVLEKADFVTYFTNSGKRLLADCMRDGQIAC